MFIILSKTVAFLLSPMVVMLFFVCLMIFFSWRRMKMALAITIGLKLLLLSPLIIWLTQWHESRAPQGQSLPTQPSTIVVLAGGTVRLLPPNGPWQPFRYLSQSGRFWEGLRLASSAPGHHIIFSRGQPEYPEGDAMLALAQEFTGDLAAERRPSLHLIDYCRNTHDEALQTKQLIESKNLPRPVYVVTSAGHMARALATFTKEIPDALPFPVDYKIEAATPKWSFDIYHLQLWSSLWHEWLGYIAYKLSGRI